MRSKFTFVIAILISCFSIAQSGINYKAVIKDGSGNIVANHGISIQFKVLQNTLVVYSELQTLSTDANGIVIANIGEGTPVSGSPAFSSIAWGDANHFLNVFVDTGAGLVDLGITQFKTVPYALDAANASLIPRNEGNGIGHRIKGRNPSNYGIIGHNAVDVSVSPVTSTTYGATGESSFAANRQTTAQGSFATAFGLDSKAYGATSTVMGFNTVANGYDAVAMGAYTVADASQSLAIGRYNVGGGNNQNWNPADPIFEIGIGSGNANRANALTVLKNGTVIAPGFTKALIDIAGDRSLVTKEYVDDNFESTGLEALNEGNGLGWRLISRNPALFGNVGLGSVDFSTSLVSSSTNGASGSNSFATGVNTMATGWFSSTFGYGAQAQSYNSMAIGRYNIGGGSYNGWLATDPLFEIGNGTSSGARSNALTVLKNGRVGIGINNPTTALDVDGVINSDAILLGGIMFLPQGSSLIKVDADWSPFTTDDFYNLGDQDHQWYSVFSLTGFANASDARLKKNITSLNYGLNEVMQLNPVSYQWKDSPNKRDKLGFLAQDLIEVLPEVVLDYEIDREKQKTATSNTADIFKPTDRMSVFYSDIIPVLTKAIQEQQTIIEDQQHQIDELKKLVLNSMNR